MSEMGENEKMVCRLCLKVPRNDVQSVEEVTREIFNVLLLKINFSLSKEPVMCVSCAECLQKFFEFKSICLYTEDRIVAVANTIDGTKVDLLEVAYFKENNNADSINTQANAICRFCMRCIGRETCIALDMLEDDFEKDIITKCLPEIDLGLTYKPVICTTCMESLTGYYGFMTTCLDVEQNIRDYCRSEEVNYGEKISLNSVYRFVIKNTLSYDETVSNNLVQVKTEGDDVELVIKNEEIDIEAELECSERTSESSFPSQQSLEFEVVVDKSRSEKKMLGCKKCTYLTENIGHMKRHILTHRDHTKIIKYKCDICYSDFTEKSYLKYHILRAHKDSTQRMDYKCDKCTYSTIHKTDLKSHMICHQNPTDEDYFRCANCLFVTVRKSTLRLHVLTHLDPSKVKLFKCKNCTFSAYTKSRLAKHNVIHEEDPKLYSCTQCIFKTRQKDSLRNHIMRLHMPAKEASIFKCNLCEYKATRKSYLVRHQEMHKKPSERPVFKCDSCSYQAKSKGSLKYHMLSHNNIKIDGNLYTTTLPALKEPREVYKCASCKFESKQKSTLKQHVVLKHNRHGINEKLLEPSGT